MLFGTYTVQFRKIRGGQAGKGAKKAREGTG
jgi:hypothetical protein